MKPDITRQPILMAFASLALVAAAAVTCGESPVTVTDPGEAFSTPLGDLLGTFQTEYPRVARTLTGLLVFLTGVLVGRLPVRYGIYPSGCTLAIPLYGLVACGISTHPGSLSECTAAFVLLLSTRNFFACFRNGYTIGRVFRASFYLGFLPLLCAPLLLLPLLVVPAAVCFRRTLREVFVGMCGAILPFLAVCYVAWGCGGDLLDVPRQMWVSFLGDGGRWGFDSVPPLAFVAAGSLSCLLVCAVFFTWTGLRTLSAKRRGMLIYTLILLVATIAATAVPVMNTTPTAIVAVPVALLLPQAFLRIRRPIGFAAYVVLYIVCIANIL